MSKSTPISGKTMAACARYSSGTWLIGFSDLAACAMNWAMTLRSIDGDGTSSNVDPEFISREADVLTACE